MKIAILGAGVSGLTLARLLTEMGHELSVLEASSSTGGLCRSSTKDGFTCDHSGGHILYSKDRKTLDWMLDRVGRDKLVQKDRNTRILWHDRYVPYPFENGIGHLTPEARYDCLKGYLEAADARKQGAPCPPDFYSWIHWRMGYGLAKHFMLPYNAKVWDCDLHEMDSAWVAGRVPDAPIDDIIKAAVGLTTEGYTHQAVFWYPETGGFQALTDGIALGIEDRILLNNPVESLRSKGDTWLVNGEDFDLCINTIPLPILAEVFEDLPVGLRDEIRELRPISLCNVLFGFPSDSPLDDLSWIYLPFKEQGPANRVTFFSNYSPQNAPAGHVSIMAEVTYRGDFEASPAWIDELAGYLESLSLLRRCDVMHTQCYQSKYAYIDQNRAFPARIAKIREYLDHSGLLSIGRFARYEYHNSDQCIQQAFQVAAHVERYAASGDPEPLEL